ncbi:MAG: nucleotidyl transferase AbiEii/AbiGii toxin family protein [Elusimicrobia bacterium]|nr:nucleotidyl transferase AbiEii/AbiGii toxin family protein [Elusimicrobiota bacterium]
MPTRSFELREFFHLALLRHLHARLSSRCAYAVKGGICLRFFHRSPRLSQDMDLDVASGFPVLKLQEAVDSILGGRAFASALLQQGITGLKVRKPKQTETTQRWKVSLFLGAGEPVPTKVEFSRRHGGIDSAAAVPDAELLWRYRTAPFAARFYDGTAMAVHKLAALAAPSRCAVRDLFDIHHLLSVVLVKPRDVAGLVDPDTVAGAADKVGRFTYGDFKEQVLPYLSERMMDLYRRAEIFERQKAEVEQALLEMLG